MAISLHASDSNAPLYSKQYNGCLYITDLQNMQFPSKTGALTVQSGEYKKLKFDDDVVAVTTKFLSKAFPCLEAQEQSYTLIKIANIVRNHPKVCVFLNDSRSIRRMCYFGSNYYFACVATQEELAPFVLAWKVLDIYQKERELSNASIPLICAALSDGISFSIDVGSFMHLKGIEFLSKLLHRAYPEKAHRNTVIFGRINKICLCNPKEAEKLVVQCINECNGSNSKVLDEMLQCIEYNAKLSKIVWYVLPSTLSLAVIGVMVYLCYCH